MSIDSNQIIIGEINKMKKVFLVLLALVLLLVLFPASLVQAKEPLQCTIDYTFAGVMEDEKFVTWQGTVDGDIEGTIKWYAVGDMRFAGQTSHYFSYWELKQGDTVILAGEDGGSTTVRHGKNSIWRANGIITFAGDGFEELLGRRTHQGGNVVWDAATGAPLEGSGIFRVN